MLDIFSNRSELGAIIRQECLYAAGDPNRHDTRGQRVTRGNRFAVSLAKRLIDRTIKLPFKLDSPQRTNRFRTIKKSRGVGIKESEAVQPKVSLTFFRGGRDKWEQSIAF